MIYIYTLFLKFFLFVTSSVSVARKFIMRPVISVSHSPGWLKRVLLRPFPRTPSGRIVPVVLCTRRPRCRRQPASERLACFYVGTRLRGAARNIITSSSRPERPTRDDAKETDEDDYDLSRPFCLYQVQSCPLCRATNARRVHSWPRPRMMNRHGVWEFSGQTPRRDPPAAEDGLPSGRHLYRRFTRSAPVVICGDHSRPTLNHIRLFPLSPCAELSGRKSSRVYARPSVRA